MFAEGKERHRKHRLHIGRPHSYRPPELLCPGSLRTGEQSQNVLSRSLYPVGRPISTQNNTVHRSLQVSEAVRNKELLGRAGAKSTDEQSLGYF